CIMRRFRLNTRDILAEAKRRRIGNERAQEFEEEVSETEERRDEIEEEDFTSDALENFGLDALAVNSVDSVRKFRFRLMKDGKPDEYATDEASNFQFADSP
uniref:Uncharacterized protein n=1 Tax=Caenorhabditis japonica TaxID=281687 RepID=A0A8R1II04_CAEJA